MFTWICPNCGREVPPSYTECPDCADRAKQAAAAPPPQPPAPTPPHQQAGPVLPHPVQTAPPPPQYQQPQYHPAAYQHAPQGHAPQGAPAYYPPQPRGGMNLPVWLMTILFALAIGGVVSGIYWLLPSNRGSAGSGPAPAAVVESPAAKPGAKTNPLQKYIEISGVRFVQDAKKKTLAKFLVINHSEMDINGLAGNGTTWG